MLRKRRKQPDATRRDAVVSAAVAAVTMGLEPLEARRLLAATPLDNTPLTTDPSVQQQPSLVVDRNNPQHVAVAYVDYSLMSSGYGGIAVSASKDGGKTWTKDHEATCKK